MDRKKRRMESQLCAAVNNGEPRSVKLLLSQGAIPDLVGSKGVAAIHLAVGKETEKNMRCLKLLLQHGADPNVKSSDGLTPLHVAAIWGCYQNLKLLLMNGGNPNIKDKEGNTPVHLAEQEDNRRCAQVLQEYLCSSVGTEEEDLPQFKYSPSGYTAELNLALKTFKLPNCQDDEQALCQQFDQPDQNRKWREGIIKSSFNYLLLDPRVTNNLPFRSHSMTPQECFQTFVNAIFYVGKGKRSRPYSHLYEALEFYKGDKTSKKLCPKVQQILQVWNAEQGVISLHCFQNVIPVEAYTREACMVEAIGLKMLTNLKRGDFYGVVSNWQLKKKRELGVHLLYRAMQIFLAEETLFYSTLILNKLQL
ncbi:ankyrin repeat and LEM domain-containing protein 1-like isoform X5 [Phycodurus eques]|uniref:ankyrin repeat and LEM domain-containing protein 1-like isoform X5 n=1 Tax=Phycodurus eques TaxID=693459 RepID=UPI002ACE338C|nr:ankyrin repeat and LEM domain-containing protein 1-like isoform X5 [Phycodurus eques]